MTDSRGAGRPGAHPRGVPSTFATVHGISVVGLPPGQWLKILRRRYRAMLTVIVVVTVSAAMVGVLRGEAYTATTSVLYQPQESDLFGMPGTPQSSAADPVSIETEAKYIVSRENLARALDVLEIRDDAGLLLPPERSGILAWLEPRRWPVDWLLPSRWLVEGGHANTPEPAVQPDPHQARARAINKLRDSLSVVQSGTSNIITIKSTSFDPVEAARIANGVATAYVEGQIEQKRRESENARTWIEQRVQQRRVQVEQSEAALRQARATLNLVEDGDNGYDSDQVAQQIATLTSEMIDARAARTAAEAMLRKAHQLMETKNYQELDDTLSSPLLIELRQEELALMRREADMSLEYGDRHPQIQRLRAEQEAVRTRIRLELDDAVRSLENEVEIGRRREEAFRESLEEAKGTGEGHAPLSDEQEAELRELKRDISADRTLYENALVRLRELEEQQYASQTDVRIVSSAETPEVPSSPSTMVFAFIGFSGSLVLGSMVAYLLEQQDSSIRSPRQIEELFGLQTLGMIPSVPAAPKSRRHLHDHLLNKPRATYAEAVRALYGRVRWINGDVWPRVLLVTSALPEEGKTSLSVSLALSAAQLKQRVLLIDLDLRRPRVAEHFGLAPKRGIRELYEVSSFHEAVQQQSDVDILASAGTCENPTAFVTSHFLQEVLREASLSYDWVIVDTPPVLGLADTKMLAPSADGVLLVVRWELAKRDALHSALNELESVSAPIIGTVLNRINMKRHAHYAYGDAGQFYKKYGKYYYSASEKKHG